MKILLESNNLKFFRLEIIDAFGDNCGGLFNSKALWNLIYDEENEDDPEIDELETLIGELEDAHTVPPHWIPGDVKFAFKDEFYNKHKSIINRIAELLTNFSYKLNVVEVTPKEIVFEDDTQIVYKIYDNGAYRMQRLKDSIKRDNTTNVIAEKSIGSESNKIKFKLVESILDEASIDPEGKYTDYGTGKVDSDNIFDSKTHTPYYDQLLSNPEYMEKEENLKGYVKMMSPREYYEECASKIFDSSVQSLINGRKANTHSTNEIKELITKYKRQVFLPYINYAEGQQEGLHRMLVAAELFGWDHKFPVLVVTWADEEKAKQKLKQDQEEYITKKIKRAVKETLEYSFEYLEDFIAQLENELADEFDENVDAWQEINRGIYAKDAPAKWKVKFDGDTTISVQVEDVVYTIDYEDINFKEPELDDIEELDWNDLDLDDEDLKNLSIDDFLKKYGM